ncbi:MAG: hypothetical protein WCO19_01055 [Candidatus Saccharibacteria bacterium]
MIHQSLHVQTFAVDEYGCSNYGQTNSYNSCQPYNTSPQTGGGKLTITGVEIGILSIVCIIIATISIIKIRSILKSDS